MHISDTISYYKKRLIDEDSSAEKCGKKFTKSDKHSFSENISKYKRMKNFIIKMFSKSSISERKHATYNNRATGNNENK
jgi:hypothetical protein